MTQLSPRHIVTIVSAVLLLLPCTISAQQTADLAGHLETGDSQNVPAKAQDAEEKVEGAVKRFRIGVEGGVGLDPELIDFGAHATFGPVFNPSVQFRPGIEFGFGEVTTTLGINLDVLYTLPGGTRQSRWSPYAGAGPNFSLSHRAFTSPEDTSTTQINRFNFSDTSFEAGLNFIAGARNRSGMFLEMRATAYGVSNVRLLAGYTF